MARKKDGDGSGYIKQKVEIDSMSDADDADSPVRNRCVSFHVLVIHLFLVRLGVGRSRHVVTVVS